MTIEKVSTAVANVTASMKSFVDPSDNGAEVKVYANTEFDLNYKIRPMLTLYNPLAPVVSIKAPLAETPEDSAEFLRKLSFSSVIFPASFYRLVIDGYVNTPDGITDAVYSVRFNRRVAFCDVYPYAIAEDGTSITWDDTVVLSDEDHLVKNEVVYDFTAMLAFQNNLPFTWQMMKTKFLHDGFEFLFHGGYNEEVLSLKSNDLV